MSNRRGKSLNDRKRKEACVHTRACLIQGLFYVFFSEFILVEF